jgi:hypothetical protein
MVRLTDFQMRLVMTSAGGLPQNKRSVFLERIGGQLGQLGGRVTDHDVERATMTALRGLLHGSAA